MKNISPVIVILIYLLIGIFVGSILQGIIDENVDEDDNPLVWYYISIVIVMLIVAAGCFIILSAERNEANLQVIDVKSALED